MISLLNIVLKITWKITFGAKLKSKLKKLNHDYKKVSWSIMVYTTSEDILKKKWKKLTFLSWFSFKNKLTTNTISGFADPFLIEYSNDLYLFFEAIVNQKGEIWSAKIYKNKLVNFQKVLTESFHISFPNVFKFEEHFYLIPESSQDNTVRLYKSVTFPTEWELYKILYKGFRFVDTNFINLEGIYYWFTFDLDSNQSRLFYSDSLFSEWIEHKQSPFESNRNAGNFIFEDNQILRPVQISKKCYGEAVKLMKIIQLNKQKFLEEDYIVPFLSSKRGYNLDATHHISIVKSKNITFVAVDGKNNNFYKVIN